MTEKIKELEKKIQELEKNIQKNKEDSLFIEIDSIFQSIKSYKDKISKRLEKVGSVNRKLYILKEVLGKSTPYNNGNNIDLENLSTPNNDGNNIELKNIDSSGKCNGLGLYFFFVNTSNIEQFIKDYSDFKDECKKIPVVRKSEPTPIAVTGHHVDTYLIYIGKSENKIISRINAHISLECSNESTASLRLKEFMKRNSNKDYKFKCAYYYTDNMDFQLILKMLENIYREELTPILGQ